MHEKSLKKIQQNHNYITSIKLILADKYLSIFPDSASG